MSDQPTPRLDILNPHVIPFNGILVLFDLEGVVTDACPGEDWEHDEAPTDDAAWEFFERHEAEVQERIEHILRENAAEDRVARIVAQREEAL